MAWRCAQGFASVSEKVAQGATVWGAHHLPQNREVFMVGGGDGSLYLYKYHYPDQRQIKVGAAAAAAAVKADLRMVTDRSVPVRAHAVMFYLMACRPLAPAACAASVWRCKRSAHTGPVRVRAEGCAG